MPRTKIENKIKENIEYDLIVKDLEKSKIDDIVTIMVNNILIKRTMIKIKDVDITQAKVIEKLMSLKKENIIEIYNSLSSSMSVNETTVLTFLLNSFEKKPKENQKNLKPSDYGRSYSIGEYTKVSWFEDPTVNCEEFYADLKRKCDEFEATHPEHRKIEEHKKVKRFKSIKERIKHNICYDYTCMALPDYFVDRTVDLICDSIKNGTEAVKHKMHRINELNMEHLRIFADPKRFEITNKEIFDFLMADTEYLHEEEQVY